MLVLEQGKTVQKNYCEAYFYEIAKLVASATPEMREKLRRRIEKEIQSEDSYYVVSGHCDRSKAVELGKTLYEWGECYLYVWLDKNGIPFYAGKGEVSGRDGDFKYNTRSTDFQARIAEGGCHSVMVVKHVSPRYIDEMERWLISYLCWKGYPLVNQKDVPSKEKMIMWSMFTKYENRVDVVSDLGEKAGELWRDWVSDMRWYKPIVDVLKSVIGEKWEGHCADITPKERKPAETLTYKGETHTWNEWGKKIGVVSGSTIRTRVKVCGWDVEKALFTPSAQAK